MRSKATHIDTLQELALGSMASSQTNRGKLIMKAGNIVRYDLARMTILLVTILASIYFGQIALAEESAKTDTVYNQATRNVVPIDRIAECLHPGIDQI